MVAEGTDRTYNHIGVPDGFHPCRHHANPRERIDELVHIQRYHMERFADFIERLAKTTKATAPSRPFAVPVRLEHGQQQRHDNYPLPLMLVGGGCGTMKGGQHLTMPEFTTVSNLHLTVVNKAGLDLKSIGDSTGEIAGV